MIIGFSTGSLAYEKVRVGLQMVAGRPTKAIELSALRENELIPLVEILDSLDLSQFEYISFHAPSKLEQLTEAEMVNQLRKVATRQWPIIVHPDVIIDFDLWKSLGSSLCLENMDKRKSTGRTACELEPFFTQLPEATLCFDIGHARQIDPTMSEASKILRQFKARLKQIHLSFVNTQSTHEPLNYESLLAYRRVASLIPETVPIILETPVSADQISSELAKVEKLFFVSEQ